MDHAADITHWSVLLLEHHQCPTKPNRRVDTYGWIKVGAQALLLYCTGHNRHRHSTLLQKCCRESKHSIPCSGGNQFSHTPRCKKCIWEAIERIFFYSIIYTTPQWVLWNQEQVALCQPTVITLQYSKSPFAYMIIDCAKSSPAMFSSKILPFFPSWNFYEQNQVLQYPSTFSTPTPLQYYLTASL